MKKHHFRSMTNAYIRAQLSMIFSSLQKSTGVGAILGTAGQQKVENRAVYGIVLRRNSQRPQVAC
jgi:hypothetical protein